MKWKEPVTALFLSLYLLLPLQAADLNTTLLSADKPLYEKLLQKFRQLRRPDQQQLLQEALLQKLIDYSGSVPEKQKTYTLPKNQKEASYLLFQWFKHLDEQSALQRQQRSLQDKMATLKAQIANVVANDTSLSTYQLQYALYARMNRQTGKMLTHLTAQTQHIENILLQIPKTLTFNQQTLMKVHRDLLAKLGKEEKTLKTFELKKERLELLDNAEALETFQKRLDRVSGQYRQVSQYLLATEFFVFCDALQKKDESAFKWEQAILHHDMDAAHREALKNLLRKMEREYLGVMHTLGDSTVEQLKETAHSARSLLSDPLFKINDTPISALKLIMVLVIFVLGFLFGGLFKRSILKPKNKDGDSEGNSYTSSRMLLSNIGYYLILLIAFFSALKVLGINLTSLAVVAGALSVGIGFGLQNIVSNFVSGLILMFERSIKIGDYVQLDDNLRGRVTDIRMRSTTIKTNENIDVVIPNQSFIQNNLINWTMEDNIRRFEIPFGVRYGTEPQKVIDVILKAVKESGFTDIYSSRNRYTRVIMTEMGDSSVNFELFVWIKGHAILYPKRLMSRFLILIYNTLNEHNIEIPFPQRDLHIRSIEADLRIEKNMASEPPEHKETK